MNDPWPWQNGERYGSTHQHWRQRCSTCAHFRAGPAADRLERRWQAVEQAMKGRR